MRVNSGGDLSVENQRHQFILEVSDVGVEGRRHLGHVGGQIGRKVLRQRAVADGGVEGVYVRRQIHVEKKIVANLAQQAQAGSVFGLVKLVDDLAKMRVQLEKELEGRVGDDVLLELLAIEGGEGAEATVDGDVVGRQKLREIAMVDVGLKEILGRRFVLLSRQLRQTRGATESKFFE